MQRHWPKIIGTFSFAMLAATALATLSAQAEGIRWQHDVEAAKVLAKQSGRLVLVHVWTPSCAPCLALDQNVFNSPSVAAAIESQFVPVKLNANENPATAEKLGITRVPTDVILTADGEMVGKLISPAAPASYVAEVSQVATQYAARARAFPSPGSPPVNAAYANLQVAPNTPPAITQPVAPINSNPMVSSTLAPSISIPTQIAPPPPLSSAPPTDSLRTAASPPIAPPMLSASNFAPPPVMPPTPVSPPLISAASASQAPAPPQGEITNPFLTAQPTAQQQLAQPPLPPPLTSTQPPVSSVSPPPFQASNTPDSTMTFNPNVAPIQPPPAQPAPTQPAPQQQQTAATITPILGTPDPKMLPPGSPPLGFDGYCPVSMRNNWKWIPGDPRWGIVHRGRTYWFASQNEQQQFWTDPDRYSPALSGMDPVMAIDHQQQVPGKREHSIDYDNLFYMFSSEATLQQFTANPERYATGVRQAMGIPRGRLVR